MNTEQIAENYVLMYKVSPSSDVELTCIHEYPMLSWKYETQIRDVKHGKTLTSKKAKDEIFRLYYESLNQTENQK